MGRPRVKIIDDAQLTAEVKNQRSKIKKTNKTEAAKLESAEAIGEVERTTEINESIPEQGTKQTNSESGGETSGASRPSEPASQKKAQKPGKAKPRSKKYQEAVKDLDRTKTYSLPEAVEMLKKSSYSKFPGTLEAHINTAQTDIRGLVALPFATGRKLRILAFGKGAETSGADVIGSDEIIDTINNGKVDCDIVITTPEWMPKLAKVARILGPKGLMPNPKNGTIANGEDGLKKAVEGFQAGKTEYKTEPKAPVIHLALGKLNQPNEELIANIKTLYQTIGKSRVKKITLSPTMGPGVKINLTNIT